MSNTNIETKTLTCRIKLDSEVFFRVVINEKVLTEKYSHFDEAVRDAGDKVEEFFNTYYDNMTSIMLNKKDEKNSLTLNF